MITFQREPQVRVVTPDAPRRERKEPLMGATPVRQVGSYSEAEGLFEEHSQGPPPLGMAGSTGSSAIGGGSLDDLDADRIDLEEVPPIGLALVFVLVGGFLLTGFRDMNNEIALWIGLAFFAAGTLPILYAAYLFRTDGRRASWDFLVSVEKSEAKSDSSQSETETTPQPSEKTRNAIRFDRANQHCEWCEERVDFLDVHHITPRSEGGPNTADNLIALCQNCHRKADRGALSESQLRGKVKRLAEVDLE